jgi:hypothetical protein
LTGNVTVRNVNKTYEHTKKIYKAIIYQQLGTPKKQTYPTISHRHVTVMLSS